MAKTLNLFETHFLYRVSMYCPITISPHLVSNPGCLMVIDNVAKHMPADGSVWVTNNTKYHNAFNITSKDPPYDAVVADVVSVLVISS